MKLIMMMSFCDMCASIGSIFGYPDNPEACRVQGALIFFFYRASWLWGTSISFSLYCQVMKGRLILTFKVLFCIIWGLSLLLEFLPVANGLSYGNCYRFAPTLDHASTFGTLSAEGIDDSKSTKTFQHWIAFTFVFPLAGTLFIMLCCHGFINWRMKPTLKMSTTDTSKKILKCLNNAEFYPLLFLVCWVPHICVFILVNNVPSLKRHAYVMVELSFAWGSSMGCWLCILYFVKSMDARRLWSLYIYQENSPYCVEEKLSQMNHSKLHIDLAEDKEHVSTVDDSSSSSGKLFFGGAAALALDLGLERDTTTSTVCGVEVTENNISARGSRSSSAVAIAMRNSSSGNGWFASRASGTMSSSYGMEQFRVYENFEDDDAYYSTPATNWGDNEDAVADDTDVDNVESKATPSSVPNKRQSRRASDIEMSDI